MRVTKYFCNKCKKEVPNDIVVKIGYKLTTVENTEQKTIDLCPACYKVLQKSLTNWFDGKKTQLIEEPTHTETEPPDTVEVTNNTEQAISVNTVDEHTEETHTEETNTELNEFGRTESQEKSFVNKLQQAKYNITDAQQVMVIALRTIGLTNAEIGDALGRTAKGISTCINAMQKNGKYEELAASLDVVRFLFTYRKYLLCDIENKLEDYIKENSEQSTEVTEQSVENVDTEEKLDERTEKSVEAFTRSVLSKEEDEREQDTTDESETSEPPQYETINYKRYDVGKILALYKAHWGINAIASEIDGRPEVVASLVQKYYHRGENV